MVSAKVSVYQILEYYQSSMIKRNIGFFAQLCKGPFVGNGTKFKMPIEIKPPVICVLNLLKTHEIYKLHIIQQI